MTTYKGYTFEYHYKFKREFNKIFRKRQCRTIKEDFKLVYDTLIQNLEEDSKFKEHVCMHMSGLAGYVTVPAFIIKKFRCGGIPQGNDSGFRITFLFDQESEKFIFVEIFMKSKKENPDKGRINDLFKKSVRIEVELYDGEESYLNN